MPVKGVDFSRPSTFLDIEAGFPENMSYNRATMRKRPGKSIIGGVVADSTQIMGLGRFEMSTTAQHIIRASKTTLERYNATALAWQSISTTPFSGGDDDFFSFATVTEAGLIAIANFIDRTRKWTGSGNNALLGGTPPYSKYLCYLSPYLLAAYTNDGISVKPWGISWCDTDNPENWSTGNSGERLLSDDASEIKNIAKLNEFVAGYKDESLWIGRKVDTARVFEFDCVATGVGLAASRAFADADGMHYFMGKKDFYVWRGGVPQSIGGSVRDEVFDTIDRYKINRCFAVHVQELGEIWFFVVVSGGSWPTVVWKYAYKTGFWYYDTCDSLTAAMKWKKTATITWDDMIGTWNEANGSWDSTVQVQGWEEILFGKSTGYVTKLDHTTTDDDGVAVSARLVTKDFIGSSLEFDTRWLQLDCWAKGPGYIYVDYSTDYGDTWVNIPYTSSQVYIDADNAWRHYQLYFDIYGKQIRFRFRNARSGENFYLKAFVPYYLSKDQTRGYRS